MATVGSSYLEYLPAIMQQGKDQGTGLGSFLLAFESILTGAGNPSAPGIEEQLDGIDDGSNFIGSQRLFIPLGTTEGRRAPGGAYLDWLAGWVALITRDDWNDDAKRRFISQMVVLYRKRGTREGMVAMLQAYTNLPSATSIIVEDFPELPNYFQVSISLNLLAYQLKELTRKQRIIQAIIDQEKPAHTFYALKIVGVQTWKLGFMDQSTLEERSTLGVSTMLGST